MSGMVTALAAPIRALLDTVGSGSLPGNGPLAGLRAAADGLDSAAGEVGRFTASTGAVWQSTGADGARQMVDAQRTHLTGLADDARSVADIGDEAAVAVAQAATGLRGVLDSFTAAADALGPTITQPPGLVALVGLAATHLSRALVIVGRTQATLAGLQRRAETIGRRRAPALPDLGQLRRVAADHSADTRGAGATSPTDPAARGASTSPASTAASASASATGKVAITLPDGSVAYAPNERAATAVRAALSQRGVPYAWGGTTPGRGLDCSALTQYAYRQAGVELPRLAQDQDTAGYRVDRGELLPGDLAVWSGHVAMVVGNGQMIEAGDPVGISPIRTSNAGQAFEGFFRPR